MAPCHKVLFGALLLGLSVISAGMYNVMDIQKQILSNQKLIVEFVSNEQKNKEDFSIEIDTVKKEVEALKQHITYVQQYMIGLQDK